MMIIKSATLLTLLALIIPGAAWLRAAERMRTGLWEITSLHNGKPAGVVANTCYTPAMVEFANASANTIRESTERNAARRGCTIKDFKVDGNHISMVRICGAKSAEISSTYSGDTFETIDTSTGGGAATVMHMKGRRIGDCK